MNETLYDIIDVRCTHPSHEDQREAYRMLGHCQNCGTGPLVGLFTSGHETSNGVLCRARCPACGCQALYWDKLAGPDDVALRPVTT